MEETGYPEKTTDLPQVTSRRYTINQNDKSLHESIYVICNWMRIITCVNITHKLIILCSTNNILSLSTSSYHNPSVIVAIVYIAFSLPTMMMPLETSNSSAVETYTIHRDYCMIFFTSDSLISPRLWYQDHGLMRVLIRKWTCFHILGTGKHFRKLTSYNKGNNKITELRTILQRESPNS